MTIAPPEEPFLVLVIEDDPRMRRLLSASLPAHGYAVVVAESGEQGLAIAASRPPGLVLLDLGLPDVDGHDVLLRLRAFSHVPVIVVTARGEEEQKVKALDAGADDYLTKPFGLPELLARIRVARRHARTEREGTPAGPIEIGKRLSIDLEARVVKKDGAEIHLTPIEFRLLAVLATHAGRVVTREQLLRDVWGNRSGTQTQYLHVYMNQLRGKLEAIPARPEHLVTEPGVGYRLRVE